MHNPMIRGSTPGFHRFASQFKIRAKPRYLPLAEFRLQKTSSSHKHHLFSHNGEHWLWGGLFKRPVFKADRPIISNGTTIKKGSEFIFAWCGTMKGHGFEPQKLLEGIFGRGNYTHYQLVVLFPGDNNPRMLFLHRDFVENRLL